MKCHTKHIPIGMTTSRFIVSTTLQTQYFCDLLGVTSKVGKDTGPLKDGATGWKYTALTWGIALKDFSVHQILLQFNNGAQMLKHQN